MKTEKILQTTAVLFAVFLTLFVGIGAVSAAENNYVITLPIGHNELVLTKDVPPYVEVSPGVWELSAPVGDFVTAKSVYGVLRHVYASEFKNGAGIPFIPELDVDYANNTIYRIGNYSANGTYVWTAFKGTAKVTNLSTAVNSNNQNVTFFLVKSTDANKNYNTQYQRAVCAYKIFPTFSHIRTIYDGNVTYSAGMNGLSALQAASENNTRFTYNVSYNVGPNNNTWLNDINGISPNYTKSGYGWALLLNNNWIYSLDTTYPAVGDSLQIWMLPSADAGNFNGTVIGANASAQSAGYYANGITDKVTIGVA